MFVSCAIFQLSLILSSHLLIFCSLYHLFFYRDLFLRCLKAIVLPIVFVNVIIAVVDMMMVGAAGGIGGKTVGLYLSTTLMAGIFGVIFSATFSRWFAEGDIDSSTPLLFDNSHYVTLECHGSDDKFLAQSSDGSILCTSDLSGENNNILWNINDVNNTFGGQESIHGSDGVEIVDMSLSDVIYEGVFEKLITDNIFVSFYEGNFAAIVVLAVALGVAAAKVIARTKTALQHPTETLFMRLLVEIDQILGVIMVWIIGCTPFAVLSMITAAIGGESDLPNLFKNVGLLVACTLLAFLSHYLITYCGGYYLFTRKNPFAYLQCIVPAQLMAVACSSSAATIPVTIKSVLSTGIVPETIARFVVPLGATVNMDGTAIYFPVACVWLAVYNGISPNVANYILLVIISTFGSMGAAPVPNAGLALIITTYNTVFGTHGTPLGFSFIFAIDWLMDRGCTALNVTGDSIVCGIIAHICPLEDISETHILSEEDSHELSISRGDGGANPTHKATQVVSSGGMAETTTDVDEEGL